MRRLELRNSRSNAVFGVVSCVVPVGAIIYSLSFSAIPWQEVRYIELKRAGSQFNEYAYLSIDLASGDPPTSLSPTWTSRRIS